MPTETCDVLIVGGGLEGCACAWQLARRGVTDVLVVERGTVASGMTAKSSGVVRCHYGVSSLAAMATDSLDVFENASEYFGDDIGFHGDGYVVGVGEASVANLRASLDAQRTVGVDTELIDRDEVAKVWPWADLEPFGAFAWERRGGYGDAYLTAQAFARTARAAGVRIRQSTGASGLIVDGDTVRGAVLGDGTRVSAGTVVIATGAWTPALLAPHGLDIPLQVHREQIVMVDPGVDIGRPPVFSDLVSLQYVRGDVGGDVLVGNSDLHEVDVADPDHYSNRADAAFLDLAVGKIAERFPGFPDAAVSGSYAGCYDVTPDWNPIISRTPLANLVVAAGFSGHGFKISPAVGRLVADLVTVGDSTDPRIPASDFRLSRFDTGELLTSPYPYAGAGQLR